MTIDNSPLGRSRHCSSVPSDKFGCKYGPTSNTTSPQLTLGTLSRRRRWRLRKFLRQVKGRPTLHMMTVFLYHKHLFVKLLFSHTLIIFWPHQAPTFLSSFSSPARHVFSKNHFIFKFSTLKIHLSLVYIWFIWL